MYVATSIFDKGIDDFHISTDHLKTKEEDGYEGFIYLLTIFLCLSRGKPKTGYEVEYYPMNPRAGITTTKWFATKEQAQKFYDDKNSRSITNITKAQLI